MIYNVTLNVCVIDGLGFRHDVTNLAFLVDDDLPRARPRRLQRLLRADDLLRPGNAGSVIRSGRTKAALLSGFGLSK